MDFLNHFLTRSHKNIFCLWYPGHKFYIFINEIQDLLANFERVLLPHEESKAYTHLFQWQRKIKSVLDSSFLLTARIGHFQNIKNNFFKDFRSVYIAETPFWPHLFWP